MLRLATAFCIAIAFVGMSATSHAASPHAVQVPPPSSMSEEALLKLAFDAASAIPVSPHEKDRARAQEEVVVAAIANGQIDLATEWVERMDTWRRGSAYAELALALAANGESPELRRFLVLASSIAEREVYWRRDRIRMKVARVHARLGEASEARRIAGTLPLEEAGKIDEVRIEALPAPAPGLDEAAIAAEQATFDAEVEMLDRIVASSTFDPTRHALSTFAALHRRHFADAARRSLIESRIRDGWALLPVDIRIDLLLTLAENARASGDATDARRLVADAVSMAEATTWIAEHEVPLLGRLAKASQEAGSPDEATRLAAKAIEVFDAKRETIFDIYRAGALRPVAEAQVARGDRESAVAIYRRAIEEGLGNPNARPRAIDLSATCISMASSGVLPDEATAERLREIRGLLKDPW